MDGAAGTAGPAAGGVDPGTGAGDPGTGDRAEIGPDPAAEGPAVNVLDWAGATPPAGATTWLRRLAGFGRARAVRLGAPLRIRDVRVMWSADVLSGLGDSAAVVALAVLLYARTGSALLVGTASALAYAPALGVGPMLATLADRWPYRRVMVGCDLLRAVCYLLVLLPSTPVPALLALVFVAHCATAPFQAARAAQMPQLAGSAYGATQALSQVTNQLAALAGFGVAGALLAVVGSRGVLAADVASFLVSAVAVASLRTRARTDASAAFAGGPAGMWWRTRAAGRTLWSDPLLRWPALMVTAAGAAGMPVASLAVVVAHAAWPGAGSHAAGPLVAVLAALVPLVGLLLSSVAPTEGDPRRLVRATGVLGAVSLGGMAVALAFVRPDRAGIAAAVVGYALLGVSEAMTVPSITVVGRRLPPDNRASVFGLLQGLLYVGNAVGILLGARLVASLGVPSGLVALAVPATLLCAVGVWALRGAAPAAAREPWDGNGRR